MRFTKGTEQKVVSVNMTVGVLDRLHQFMIDNHNTNRSSIIEEAIKMFLDAEEKKHIG